MRTRRISEDFSFRRGGFKRWYTTADNPTDRWWSITRWQWERVVVHLLTLGILWTILKPFLIDGLHCGGYTDFKGSWGWIRTLTNRTHSTLGQTCKPQISLQSKRLYSSYSPAHALEKTFINTCRGSNWSWKCMLSKKARMVALRCRWCHPRKSRWQWRWGRWENRGSRWW